MRVIVNCGFDIVRDSKINRRPTIAGSKVTSKHSVCNDVIGLEDFGSPSS